MDGLNVTQAEHLHTPCVCVALDKSDLIRLNMLQEVIIISALGIGNQYGFLLKMLLKR